MYDTDDLPAAVATADPATVRRARLGLVLRHLSDQGPRSRARIAADLGLTRAAASALVDELETLGLVRPGARERGGVGRPGTTVELHGAAVCGVGAEVNVDHVAVLALDLAGATVIEVRRGIDSRRLGPAGVLDELAELVAGVVGDVTARGGRATGITVGVPGLVETAHDRVTLAPNLGWGGLAVAEELRGRLTAAGLADLPPVHADNEATLAAIAELDPADPDRSDMLVLYGEVGLGGGLVADGRLLRGRRGWAGEVGHLVVDPQGRPCGCGRVGCWETVVGLRALLADATTPDDPARDPALTLEARLGLLVDRARRGDCRTLTALQKVGTWLGTGAAGLVNVLDPGVVVLSGYFAVLGEWLRPAVEAQLEAGVLAPRAGGARVEVSAHGPTAAVRGGALVSLEAVFTDPTGVPLLADAPNGGTR